MDVEKTIRDYLPQVIHMSLGTSKDNKAWVCEVHFAYDDHLNLYFRSLPSRRHSKEILENPNVAGNIVTQHDLTQKPQAVYFEGTAKVIDSGEDLSVAFGCLSDRLKIGAEALEEHKDPEGHKFFKISVTNFYLFDSRESNPSQKYSLPWKG